MAKNTQELIETLWVAARKNITPENYESTSIRELVIECDEKTKNTELIAEILPIFDEFVTWFVDLSGLIVASLMMHKRHKQKQKWRALVTVTSGIVSQLIAIRRLVLAGLDLPAKQILRCLVEHIDLAISLSFDEKMIGYYLYYNRVSGNRGAKKFWQKSLQRKNGAHISDRMYVEYAARGISKSNIQKIRKYRQVEEDVLNACTHPSFVALSINTVGTNIKEDVAYSLPFHGSIDESLLRTIHYAVYVLGQYVMIGYVPTVDELSKSTRKETFLRGGYSHLKGARIVLLGLLDYLQRGH